MKKLIFRQGDVMLIAVDALPPDAQLVKTDGRVVLAFGEVTGHLHQISDDEAQEYRAKQPVPVFDAQAERFIQVLTKAELRHEEHSTIELPAGCYAIVIQREYHPEEIRSVTD